MSRRRAAAATTPRATAAHAWTTRRFVSIAGLVAAALVAIGYGRTLGFPFQFDDFDWIRDNAALGPPLDPGAIWRFRPSRFVPDLSFALQIAAWGRDVSALRLANLAIHVLASVLAGACARAIGRQTSPGATRRADVAGLLAAGLFAAHPLATQAVTYVTQRITSLTAVLELACLAAFLSARASGSRRAWSATWAFGFAAALGKEMAAALPLALAAIEWVLRRAGAAGRAPWPRPLPLALVPVLCAVLARAPLGPEARVASAFAETGDLTRTEYALTQCVVVPRYAALFAWPRGQQLDPWIAPRRAPDVAVLAGAAALLLALAAALAGARGAASLRPARCGSSPRSRPSRASCRFGTSRTSTARTCRWRASAWTAAAALAASGARGGPRRRAVAAIAAIAIVLALAFATRARNEVWRSGRALWGDTVARSPRSARAQNNYGLALAEDGDPAGAEAAFRAAIAAEPRHLAARANLGMLYGRAGRLDEAIAILEEGRRYGPGDPRLNSNLGVAYWQRGDTARAAAAFERALATDPAERGARSNLNRLRLGLPPR